MGVSRRSYAAQRGVSEAAVRKAIATGRITTLPDGTIDPTRADAEWGVPTDRATQRCMHACLMAMDITDGAVKDAIKTVTNTLDDI